MTVNNLHRELAPVSSAAWAEIEEEAARTFKRNIAGRRVVDMPEAKGAEFSSLGTGHLKHSRDIVPGAQTVSREIIPVLEVKVPFTVTRSAVDDVLRGSVDSDWQPVKDAATTVAAAEDTVVFHGNDSLGMTGLVDSSSNESISIPDEVREFPEAVAQALTRLRLVGVEGPYTLVVSAELYTKISETTDHGYPILEHIQRVLKDEGKIIWAPALNGALVLSERGGDFELHLGVDLSIGYDSHDSENVNLYLKESFAFRVASDEASVPLSR
ncbi:MULTISPECIES: family 1 encapsulin nanocompartment shell protein [Micrococcaceae]|uniref:family 1 encapsulin nanocompartment shell protein n=1 Tax=unclassified Kocuria TaxID=2649579 RepID=UPI001012E6EA|nr:MULTISPECIES: family 1 encapsulin nanocompartment shell protein [unclassified Kocuria]